MTFVNVFFGPVYSFLLGIVYMEGGGIDGMDFYVDLERVSSLTVG